MQISRTQTGSTGPSSMKVAAQAAKLESLLWGQVLAGMTRTALGGKNALGTGSGIYNSLARRAVAGRLFNHTDSRLTKSIVSDLSRPTDSSTKAGAPSRPSTLDALRGAAAPVPQGGAPQQAVTFARKIWPAVKHTANALNVSPVAILAQTALETGWGASMPGNNPLGIKATSPDQPSNTAATREFGKGGWRSTTAQFAAFPSLSSALHHFEALVRRQYPGVVGSQSVSQYANALAAGGYATDPQYASHIVNVAQSATMHDVLSKLEGV